MAAVEQAVRLQGAGTDPSGSATVTDIAAQLAAEMQGLRVALVHDYLLHMRGGERVFATLRRIYPHADVFALVYDHAAMERAFDFGEVKTSFIQHLPLARSHFRAYLPLYSIAAAHLDLASYDLIISSSSAWVHGVQNVGHAWHICYCHTPFRFAWSEYERIIGPCSPYAPPVRWALRPILASVRRHDVAMAQRVDHYIANSHVVQERIAQYYGRTSTVIHPPLDTVRFKPSREHDTYFLVVSALVDYKRVDVAVRAFTRLGWPLMIVGDGPQRDTLKRIAGPSVHFLGTVPDYLLAHLYKRCQALIFTANEDFGIAPLEAQASGRPVVAFAAGGALETVVPGKTGMLFPAQEPGALVDALQSFDPDAFEPRTLHAHARHFGEDRFAAEFASLVREQLPQIRERKRASERASAPAFGTQPHDAGISRLMVTPGEDEALAHDETCHESEVAVRRNQPYEAAKRTLDIIGSAVGLTLLAPLFAAIAVRIKLEDRGPAIYRREVIGRGGRRFEALKFRTMIPNADAYLLSHPDLAAEYAENVKLRRDPRVTRVGAVLRRTSLDELPQLVNVLRGEMSLVGPRMIHPSERERFGALADLREQVLPGITGLWQVSGRQDVSYDERIRLDQRYLRERSLKLDLQILARTALVLLHREGAY